MADETTGQAIGLDHVLAHVVIDNPEKVLAWVQGKPGAWGFLAGKSVTAARDYVGRTLSDTERRIVWKRMWWWLEEVKARLPKCI